MNNEAEIGTLRKIYALWKFIGVVLFLNFIAWTAMVVFLGGEAVSGKTEGERYYLHSRTGYVEASSQVFQYSKVHTYSVYVSGPFCLLAIFSANRVRARLHELTGE